VDFVVWILVGLIAGGIARWIVKDSRSGCLYTIVVGVIGALIGGALVRAAGIDDAGTEFGVSIITAIVGAVLLLLILQAISGASNRRRR
jgi:uncharacterized membrane protein YeaQ/YmgE (transglycosylase-associated protein family)